MFEEHTTHISQLNIIFDTIKLIIAERKVNPTEHVIACLCQYSDCIKDCIKDCIDQVFDNKGRIKWLVVWKKKNKISGI